MKVMNINPGRGVAHGTLRVCLCKIDAYNRKEIGRFLKEAIAPQKVIYGECSHPLNAEDRLANSLEDISTERISHLFFNFSIAQFGPYSYLTADVRAAGFEAKVAERCFKDNKICFEARAQYVIGDNNRLEMKRLIAFDLVSFKEFERAKVEDTAIIECSEGGLMRLSNPDNATNHPEFDGFEITPDRDYISKWTADFVSPLIDQYPHGEIFAIQVNELKPVPIEFKTLGNALNEYRTVFVSSPRQKGQTSFLHELSARNDCLFVTKNTHLARNFNDKGFVGGEALPFKNLLTKTDAQLQELLEGKQKVVFDDVEAIGLNTVRSFVRNNIEPLVDPDNFIIVIGL